MKILPGGARRRLSFANVASCPALFVALGRTSYAAIKLPANSVGQREIKTGGVGNTEIAANGVRKWEIASNAVGKAEIATSAVGQSEIAEPPPSAPAAAPELRRYERDRRRRDRAGRPLGHGQDGWASAAPRSRAPARTPAATPRR